MKTCPICKARCFDDMAICYGCMHRFEADTSEIPPDETKMFPPVQAEGITPRPLSQRRAARRGRNAERSPETAPARDDAQDGQATRMPDAPNGPDGLDSPYTPVAPAAPIAPTAPPASAVTGSTGAPDAANAGSVANADVDKVLADLTQSIPLLTKGMPVGKDAAQPGKLVVPLGNGYRLVISVEPE